MGDFIIILILIVIFACLAWLLYKANKLQKKNIYVYPKTKNKYLAKGIVKMKDTLSNEWMQSFILVLRMNSIMLGIKGNSLTSL